MNFKVGTTFKYRNGPGRPSKAHVLAIVDGDNIVFKWYGRHKQWWHYEVRSAYLLESYVVEE